MDIDECAFPDLNTCGGGMYPHGVDADMALDKAIYKYAMYIGETNGLSKVNFVQIREAFIKKKV